MPAKQNDFLPVKAVAIDLDGTLLGPDLTISAENRAAIELLHSNGIHIILASGRHHISMTPYAQTLPQVEWMISSQGSCAANLDLSTILYDSHLDRSYASYIIDVGTRLKYSIVVYAKSGIFALNESEWIEYYTKLAGITPTATNKENVLNEAIFKVVLLDTEERIDALFDVPEVQQWELNKVRSLKNIFEFAGAGTTKAYGLRPLLNHLHISPGELATFGDAPNDIPMFELSGYSFAVDHAWPEAKRSARFVAPAGDPASAFARCVDLLLEITQARRSP